jgi:hypothetical protein
MEGGRGPEIDRIKTRIKETLHNRRTSEGRRILSYESDQEIIFEEDRPWKISYLDTEVAKNGERNPSQWTVRLNASLDQVMQGLARPATLLQPQLLMDECFDDTDEICALHQLAAKTDIDYGTLFEEFQKLHWEF